MWSNSHKKPNAPLRASSNALPGGETPNKIVTLINVCKHLPVLAKQSAKRKTSIFVNRTNPCYLESRPERSEIVQTATVTDFDIRNSDAVSPTLVLLLCTWGWVATNHLTKFRFLFLQPVVHRPNFRRSFEVNEPRNLNAWLLEKTQNRHGSTKHLVACRSLRMVVGREEICTRWQRWRDDVGFLANAVSDFEQTSNSILIWYVIISLTKPWEWHVM